MNIKCQIPDQIIRNLRTSDPLLNQCQAFADVCRYLEVFAATYQHWQHLQGVVDVQEHFLLSPKTDGS